jgi:hypothetical protein
MKDTKGFFKAFRGSKVIYNVMGLVKDQALERITSSPGVCISWQVAPQQSLLPLSISIHKCKPISVLYLNCKVISELVEKSVNFF